MTISIYRRPSFALALGGIVLVIAFLMLSGGLSTQAAPTGRIWMADPSSDMVFRVDNDGTGLMSVSVPNAFDVAFDDTQAYVTQFDSRTIAVLLRSDMSPVTTLTPPWASLQLDPNGLDSGGALSGIDVVPGTPTVYTANEGGFTELGPVSGQSTYGRCDAESDNPGGPCTITDINHTDADPVLKYEGPWSVQYLIDRSQTVGGFSQADPFSDPPPSGTLPNFNRGLALSPDNQFLYLGYNNPNGTNAGIHDKQVRKVDTTEPDYTNATVAILQGNRGKALATDDVGRVYMAEGSDTDTLDGPGIHIYSADLSTKLADIGLGGLNGLARPEGVATTREAGALVLYVTDRTNKTLSRFVITEAPVGDGIVAITRAGLDGDGEITIPGAASLRGVEVEPLEAPTPTPIVTNSPTPVVTNSPTPVVTNSPTPVVTNSPTPVVTNSPTPVVTNSPTPIVTNSPTPVVTNSPTPVVTNSPTPVVTNSPTPVVTNSPTPVVTNSPTPSPTVLPGTQTPAPTGAVGGLVDVVTMGGTGSSSGGLSIFALLAIMLAISAVSGSGLYVFIRRRY